MYIYIYIYIYKRGVGGGYMLTEMLLPSNCSTGNRVSSFSKRTSGIIACLSGGGSAGELGARAAGWIGGLARLR